jgi:hypothetical protein
MYCAVHHASLALKMEVQIIGDGNLWMTRWFLSLISSYGSLPPVKVNTFREYFNDWPECAEASHGCGQK